MMQSSAFKQANQPVERASDRGRGDGEPQGVQTAAAKPQTASKTWLKAWRANIKRVP